MVEMIVEMTDETVGKATMASEIETTRARRMRSRERIKSRKRRRLTDRSPRRNGTTLPNRRSVFCFHSSFSVVRCGNVVMYCANERTKEKNETDTISFAQKDVSLSKREGELKEGLLRKKLQGKAGGISIKGASVAGSTEK